MSHSMKWASYSLLVLFTPFLTAAQSPNAQPTKIVLGTVLTFLEKIVQIIMWLSLVLFGWGIIKLIIAAGDPGKVKDAKGILVWGIVGVFILASIYGLLYFIKTYIGIPTKPFIQAPLFTN